MNTIIRKVWRQDKPVPQDDLSGYMFTPESQAHTFIIDGRNNNMPVAINGTVTGEFLNQDGVTVPLTGNASGTVELTLSRECYVVPGRFELTIYVTSGSHTTCVYYGIGTVRKPNSDTVAYPSTALPDLVELMSEFQNGMSSIYSAFPSESVGPADVVSFSDGADNIPVKSLSVAIEPVQDLHGYDNPWVGGAGNNLIPITNASYSVGTITIVENSDGSITVNGSHGSTVGCQIFQNIENSLPAGTYYFKLFGAVEGLTLQQYKNGSSSANAVKGTMSFADGDTNYLCIRCAPNITYNNVTVYPMLVAGETEPTDWEPYSNICPISGWDEANVTRTGKNLYDKNAVSTGGYLKATGVYTNSANYNETDYIPVKAGNTYTISGCTASGNDPSVVWFDKNKNYISGAQHQSHTFPYTYTAPAGAYYMREAVHNDDLNTAQIEDGSTATAYEPYHSDTYTVSLTSAGTVYGGTLTINSDGSGTVVVDKASVDLGDLTWSYSSNYFNVQKDDIQTATGNNPIRNATSELISDRYIYTSSSGMYDYCVYQSTNSIRIKNAGYNDATVFKTAMSGSLLVYELATPVTYTLTSTQLRTLLGTNNVWADCGNVSVVYRADTGLYIDKKLAELSAAIVNS